MTDSPTSQAMHLAMTELKEREQRIALLEEELAKERADAERYRWLRDEAHPDREDRGLCVAEQDFTTWGKPYWRFFSGEALDSAIDAARSVLNKETNRPKGNA